MAEHLIELRNVTKSFGSVNAVENVSFYVDDGEVIGRRGLNKLRYLNHCDAPNAEFDGFDLYTLREIEPGEEITINYDAA